MFFEIIEIDSSNPSIALMTSLDLISALSDIPPLLFKYLVINTNTIIAQEELIMYSQVYIQVRLSVL
jgi:hypothetical protein